MSMEQFSDRFEFFRKATQKYNVFTRIYHRFICVSTLKTINPADDVSTCEQAVIHHTAMPACPHGPHRAPLGAFRKKKDQRDP